MLNGKIRILGGANGLGNEVLRVSVMEVADFYTYSFERGLFLLSTFSCFQNDREQMILAFRELAKKKLSGILLKLNRFVADIPRELCELADRYGVPLLATEENLKFRDVLYQIISEICSDQMKSSVLHELLFNPQTNGEYALERLRLLGFSPTESVAAAALFPRDGSRVPEPWLQLRRAAELSRTEIPGSVMLPIGSGAILIAPLTSNPAVSTVRQLGSACASFLERSGAAAAFRVGISRPFIEYQSLGAAWEEAKKALRYAELLDCPQVSCSYDEFLELEIVTHLLGSPEQQRLHDSIISPVAAYDAHFHSELWYSLRTCFSAPTLKEAAEALHIHTSTLRYRLEKLRELTGFDYFSESEKYLLRTAYLLSLLERGSE